MLRVPAEQLAQTCRKQHKLVEKELNSAMGEIHEVLKDRHAGHPMNGLVARLQSLKRKVEDGQVQEDGLLQDAACAWTISRTCMSGTPTRRTGTRRKPAAAAAGGRLLAPRGV